jgi:hypothetical protein
MTESSFRVGLADYSASPKALQLKNGEQTNSEHFLIL